MSASTVSITANTATNRRRPVIVGEKRSGLDLVGIDVPSPTSGGEIGVVDKTPSLSIERSRRDSVVQAKKLPPNSINVTNKPSHRTSVRKGGSKPKWQTVVSVFTKNLLLLLLLAGLVQMIRRLYSSNSVLYSDNVDGRIAEVEEFFKKTTKMMQVQVDVVDRKIERLEGKVVEIGSELGKQGEKTESLEKHLSSNEWLPKGEFDKFVEDYKKAKVGSKGDEVDVSLDEVRAFAREVVEKEIEKHAADGLGRVDYALATGGAVVVKHSEPFIGGIKGGWFGANRNGVHGNAKKMLRPSFGEPGECFPLKGSSGFVQIRLRTAIVPEAITLEHVAKSVAYDRSSAPKDCRVSGWLGGQQTSDVTLENEKMFSLTEFTYDLEKSNAQTFNVLDSVDIGIVDMIRLDFSSNHGHPSHTCIYRFRVHGHEPDSVLPLAVQS